MDCVLSCHVYQILPVDDMEIRLNWVNLEKVLIKAFYRLKLADYGPR